MQTDNRSVGAVRLRQYLDREGLLYSRMATRIGIRPETLSRIMSGRSLPLAKTRIAIQNETNSYVRFEEWESPANQ